MVDEPNKPYENDSFMDEDGFLAADRINDEDGTESGGTSKPNLKEIWAQNPSLKIFAVVAFLAVLLISYLVFGAGGDKEPEGESVVRQAGEVSQPPGTTELPPAYEEAVREESARRAEEATQSGGSSIPTPIARPSERIEAPVQVEENDPLSEWRREAETRRIERQQGDTPAGQEATATTPPVLPVNNVQTPSSQPPQQVAGGIGAAPAAEAPPPLPTAPDPEVVSTMSQQLQTQMQTILETQVPKESVVVSMNIQPGYDMKKYFPPENAAQGQGNNNAGNNSANNASSANKPVVKPLIQAGTIAYAQILTQANSDVPGPVLAEIASGPLLGGRAIGQFRVAQKHLVIQFNRVVKDGVEYSVQGYALDPGTTLPGVVTDVDNHYFSRVFLPAAARFIQGFADAATQQDTSVVVSDGTVVSNTTNDLDTKEELLEGVNEGAQKFADIIDQSAQRPITVRVDAGTRIGLLFLNSVFDPATAQGQQQVQANQQNGQGQYGQYNNGNQSSFASRANQAYNAYNNSGSNSMQTQQTRTGTTMQQPYIDTPTNFR